jgi:hypothetical protein
MPVLRSCHPNKDGAANPSTGTAPWPRAHHAFLTRTTRVEMRLSRLVVPRCQPQGDIIADNLWATRVPLSTTRVKDSCSMLAVGTCAG